VTTMMITKVRMVKPGGGEWWYAKSTATVAMEFDPHTDPDEALFLFLKDAFEELFANCHEWETETQVRVET
jgi:hypothetical protein